MTGVVSCFVKSAEAVTNVMNLPQSGIAECTALGGQTVDSTP